MILYKLRRKIKYWQFELRNGWYNFEGTIRYRINPQKKEAFDKNYIDKQLAKLK